MIRAAAVLAWIAGVGFGIPAAIGAVYFARHHEVWLLAGLPTNGNGPFEDWGIPDSTGLQAAFVAVCAAEVVLGFRLWSRRGRILSLALLPVELTFWIGFALPFGFGLGIGRVALTLLRSRDAAGPHAPSHRSGAHK